MKTINQIINQYKNDNANMYVHTDNQPLKLKIKYDVIIIDGNHSHDQTLDDFATALNHINQNGIIILHDIYPDNVEYTQPEWCGTAFKTAYSIIEGKYKYEISLDDHGILYVYFTDKLPIGSNHQLTYDEWIKYVEKISTPIVEVAKHKRGRRKKNQ